MINLCRLPIPGDNFNYLDERRKDPGIMVRRDSSRKSKGSPSRRKSVIE